MPGVLRYERVGEEELSAVVCMQGEHNTQHPPPPRGDCWVAVLDPPSQALREEKVSVGVGRGLFLGVTERDEIKKSLLHKHTPPF